MLSPRAGHLPPAQLPSPTLSNLNLTPLSCLKVSGGVEIKKGGTPSFGVKILYFLLLGSYLLNLVKYVTSILVFPYCCNFFLLQCFAHVEGEVLNDVMDDL